jgi:hypothetical protein
MLSPLALTSHHRRADAGSSLQNDAPRQGSELLNLGLEVAAADVGVVSENAV